MVTILGEGSFHQLHGGTTTNDPEHVDRRTKIFSYGEHYRDLRGRTLRGPAKVMHYVGSLPVDSARRTRARRMTAPIVRRHPLGRRTRRRARPIAEHMPDEQRTALIEAYWRGLSWQDQRWLGHPISAAPTDLLVYQEIVASVRPEWIVETGTARRRPRVLPRDGLRAARPRSGDLGRATTPASGPSTRASPTCASRRTRSARQREGRRARRRRTPNALVILGSPRRHASGCSSSSRRYAPLVPVGSYVIFENTIVNGRPVWPGYGAGPGRGRPADPRARRRLRAGHVAGRSTR